MNTKTYSRLSKEVYAQENIDYDTIHPAMMQESKYKRAHIEQYIQEKTDKIPPFTHQIYLSNPKNLKKLEGLSLKHCVITTKKLNELYNFKHYIWTNDIATIPQELSSIKGVEIHLINELEHLGIFSLVTNLLGKHITNKVPLVMASDILRILVVKEFGGIYHDLDYILYNPYLLIPFLQAFNFIAGEEYTEKRYFFIGNAFFASTPNHPILREASKLIERNLNTDSDKIKPDYLKYPATIFDKVIYETSPGMFSIAFMKGYGLENNNDILLPGYFLYNFEYLWKTTPESKCYNPNLESSLVTIYDQEVITTIGADQFCGDWAHGGIYSSLINY